MAKLPLVQLRLNNKIPTPWWQKAPIFGAFFVCKVVLKRCFFAHVLPILQNSVQNSCSKHTITYHLSPLTSHFLSVPCCCFCCKWRSFFEKWCDLAGWNKPLFCVLLQWCACLDFVHCIFNTRIGSFCKSYYKIHYTKHTLTSRFSLISTHVLAVLSLQQQARGSVLPTFSHTYCRFCKISTKLLFKTHRNLSLIASRFSLSIRPVVRF